MIEVTQTRFGKDGNCQQAALASIFELPLEEVPDFVHGGHDDWWSPMAEWILERFRLWPLCLDAQSCRDAEIEWTPPGYHIIAGDGPRGHRHATVGYMGVVVWDPHPSRDGLLSEDEWTVYVHPMERQNGTTG